MQGLQVWLQVVTKVLDSLFVQLDISYVANKPVEFFDRFRNFISIGEANKCTQLFYLYPEFMIVIGIKIM